MFHFDHVSFDVVAAAPPDHLLEEMVMCHVDSWEVTLHDLLKAVE